jgi:hypothetical protein
MNGLNEKQKELADFINKGLTEKGCSMQVSNFHGFLDTILEFVQNKELDAKASILNDEAINDSLTISDSEKAIIRARKVLSQIGSD